jgi:glucosamine-6-phosphate deaminase
MLQHFGNPRFRLESIGHTNGWRSGAHTIRRVQYGNAVFLLVLDDCGKLRRAGNTTQKFTSAPRQTNVILKVFHDKIHLGQAAAAQAAEIIKRAIAAKGQARIIAATGMSQFEFLQALIATPGIDWTHVEMFHLDEYVGLPLAHPASFRKYLLERFIEPAGLTSFHLLDGEADPAEACRSVGALIQSAPIDVAFVGVGENGHLAFNDPPADFETEEAYIVVKLDEACRRQQVGEGWFAGLEDVPKQAISMTINQILKAEEIICIVPDARKAQAVKACLEGEISPLVPASALRKHDKVTLYLDDHSAALLDPKTTAENTRDAARD